jgi:hypothetical protein
MKTPILNFHWFAFSCIVSLMLPWGCFCGEDVTASPQKVPLDILIGRFNRVEEKGVAYDKAHPPSDNWGGWTELACQLVNTMSKQGGRDALPFLEEKSLSSSTCKSVRWRTALSYANLATAVECATFLPKILKIRNETVWTASWRADVVPACINKIEEAIAKNELPDETLKLLVTKLLAHTQSPSVPRLADGDVIDGFLNRHCDGYSTSKQRLAMWTNYLNELGKESWEEDLRKKFTPVKESVEAVPPRKRVDLRKRFPNLPPLPEDKNAGLSLKIVLAIGAAFAAICVAIWIMAKRRKTQTR